MSKYSELIDRISEDLEKRKVYVKSFKPPAGTPLYRGKLGSYFWYPKPGQAMSSNDVKKVDDENKTHPYEGLNRVPTHKPNRVRPCMCRYCGRYTDNQRCEAYPDGIPNVIIQGWIDHQYPYDGDNGLMWIPVGSDNDLSL